MRGAAQWLHQLPAVANDCQHVLHCVRFLYFLNAVRCEALDIGYIDGMLLLPLIVEHNIGGANSATGSAAPAL